MVNFIVVSEYDRTEGEPVGRKKIAGGPLYPLTRVHSLCADDAGLMLWTRDCASNVQVLGLDAEGVAALIRELGPSDYLDSEWCGNGRGAWAACDAYRLMRNEWVERAGKTFPMEYFLKFAINRQGHLVLVVSCHLS